MCLKTKKGEYFRAKEDITCYTVVYLVGRKKWTGSFSYSNKEFEFDVVLKETTGKPKVVKSYNPFEKEKEVYVELNGGYFHSCFTKERCETLLGRSKSKRKYYGLPARKENFAICQCTIPKGTVYYEDGYSGEYASRKIIVHKPKKL